MATNSAPSRSLEFTGYYSFIVLGWQIVVLPTLIRPIETGFHQSDAAFGALYLIKSLLYAAGAFAGGFLTERFGRRVVLSSAAALSGISLLVAAIAPTWAPFVVGASVTSMGGAVIDGGVNGLFLDLFREARGGALNFLHLFFSVGALVAPFPIGLLLAAGVGWRPIVFVTGIGAMAMVLPLALLPMPSGRRSKAPDEDIGEEDPGEQRMLPFVALAAAIGLYVAAEIGVSSWVVRLLSNQPVAVATGALSIFWLGLALGRLLSRWAAEVLDYTVFTVLCMLLASISLAGAVLVPALPVALVLYGLTGLFFGPIYPMIMAIGGQLYPHRLAALSGGLTTGAALGGIMYPPLMGLMAAGVGLKTGMLGAAALGVPSAVCLILARTAATRRVAPVAGETAA